MTTAGHPLAVGDTVSPLDSFAGEIPRTKTGPLYTAGLAVVAFAMVLLPLIYIGLIFLTGWGVVMHLTHDTWIFDGATGRGGLLRLILYIGPAVAGAILVFFMVKPFFAKKAKEPDPITLDPAREPLLFSFVQKICALVGAPPPCRIDVDCQVNASASLRRGLWSRDLVLTIGLPLASGLDMRQFAGVLAHEFGHFAQGAGMRLTYVIRRINFWFARVVYERDAWDVRLAETASNTDLRLGIVLHAARGCVWLTRRVLWALMHAGHAISCFMLRQMEFDADSYETKLAGSDAFESTATRLRVLNVATQVAYEDVRQSWASNRLPENLPLLISHKAGTLSADVRQKLTASSTSEKTGWFDTHPCDADRVRMARRLGERGVFHLESPATGLFADFHALSCAVTRHQYKKHLELKFSERNLMSAEEILRESAASAEADAMVGQYYGGVNVSLLPLLRSGELPAVAPDHAARLRQARAAGDALREEAVKFSAGWIEQHRRIVDLTSALHLAAAGFKLQPAEFGLPGHATTPGEQESAARAALNAAASEASALLSGLEPFLAALRERVTLALALAAASAPSASATSPSSSSSAGDESAASAASSVSSAEPSTPAPGRAAGASGAGDAGEVAGMARLLAVVGAEMPRAYEMAVTLAAFKMLVQNRGNHSSPGEVDQAATQLAAELQQMVGGMQERLAPFAYPFAHARGRLTVAEYARPDEASEHEWQRAYMEASSHIDKLFALHYRLIGKVLAHANAAEKAEAEPAAV